MKKIYDIIHYEDIIKNRGIVLLEQIAKFYYDYLKDDISQLIEISKITVIEKLFKIILS